MLADGLFQSVSIAALHADGLLEREILGPRRELYRLRLRSRSLPTLLPLQLLKFAELCARVIGLALRQRPHVVNVHTLGLLPVGVLFKLLFRTRLVYDAHELETEVEGLVGLRQRLARLVERSLIGYCDAVCVVNRSIADWYEKAYGLARVWVVHNMPRRMTAVPQRTGLLRQAIGLNSPDALLFIYQGMLSSGRGIEMLLDVFAGINGDRHLVCMGYGPLEEQVRQAAQGHPNIHFMPAVAPELVKDYTVDADVGLSLIENTCLSYYLCAPNKLYEYTACGVASIVSDFPEMSRFVDSHDCGWKVEPSVVALGQLIRSIDAEVLAAKRANAVRAGVQYCWENEEPELLRMYESLGLNTRLSGANPPLRD